MAARLSYKGFEGPVFIIKKRNRKMMVYKPMALITPWFSKE